METVGQNVTIEPEVMALVKSGPQFSQITTAIQANEVVEFRGLIRGMRSRVADFFKPDIDRAHKLHKSLLAKMKSIDDPLALADQKFGQMIGSYQMGLEAKRREEQRRLDEKARQEAAEAARAEGNKAEARDIERGKIAVVSEVVAPPPPKLEGVSVREDWKAEVVDLKILCADVAKGKSPLEYIEPNMPVLNRVMKATKGTVNIPGVKAVKSIVTIQRKGNGSDADVF